MFLESSKMKLFRHLGWWACVSLIWQNRDWITWGPHCVWLTQTQIPHTPTPPHTSPPQACCIQVTWYTWLIDRTLRKGKKSFLEPKKSWSWFCRRQISLLEFLKIQLNGDTIWETETGKWSGCPSAACSWRFMKMFSSNQHLLFKKRSKREMSCETKHMCC